MFFQICVKHITIDDDDLVTQYLLMKFQHVSCNNRYIHKKRSKYFFRDPWNVTPLAFSPLVTPIYDAPFRSNDFLYLLVHPSLLALFLFPLSVPQFLALEARRRDGCDRRRAIREHDYRSLHYASSTFTGVPVKWLLNPARLDEFTIILRAGTKRRLLPQALTELNPFVTPSACIHRDCSPPFFPLALPVCFQFTMRELERV